MMLEDSSSDPKIITKKCKIEEFGGKPIKQFLTFYTNEVLFIITQYDKMGTFVILIFFFQKNTY